ncbi:MAG: peptidase M23 [Candidatus Magasanikbacteria bacterium CG10_big_fil_rev_8_21_14_0_10_36_16]|uniref:Peptidase M23 n=1 Tax=Candidatus Magasanikbacteria bacterium CG10_big_fil_rev_8_21_14_0_10_36_16 TaxID=1974645 RepID=A0A2H0TZM6_9BACT|nr:MAG: peptidase M23 [Candidatus Magasanikbacteria bacterium CG10_big_fil_rev_8_21_14_0_10_36_16]
MKKIFLPLLIFVIAGGAIFFVRIGHTEKPPSEPENTLEVKGIKEEPKYNIQTHIVADNDTFAKVMSDFGIDYSEMLAIVDSASSTYDMTSIKLGQPIRLAKDESGKDAYLEYETGKENYIHIDFLNDGKFSVEKKAIEYKTEIVKQSATINNSMYLDGLDANIPEGVIIDFADVFAWTIDFSVQVQKDDSFEILYEKRSREGQEPNYGRVLAGKFVNSGKVYTAYLFEDEEGKATYYSAEGENLQKQFLKAPLEFKRITSGFTYARFDPINYSKQKHLAIDYAASMGTPVLAVGDGTIEFAGWSTIGFGNFVSIHHNDTYTTQYAHMSAFGPGIKKGVHVVQGQVIGYVGSTGHSTGPHLHYQIKENGVLVNPLNLDLPAGDPVPEDKLEEFKKIVQEYNNLMK